MPIFVVEKTVLQDLPHERRTQVVVMDSSREGAIAKLKKKFGDRYAEMLVEEVPLVIE